MPIVADHYELVVGIDTHAANHALSVVATATGATVNQASFPTNPAGLDRARTWITNRAGERTVLVVVEGIGSYGAGLAQRLIAAGLPVVEPSAMAAADRRGTGKTDALDGSTHR